MPSTPATAPGNGPPTSNAATPTRARPSGSLGTGHRLVHCGLIFNAIFDTDNLTMMMMMIMMMMRRRRRRRILLMMMMIMIMMGVLLTVMVVVAVVMMVLPLLTLTSC